MSQDNETDNELQIMRHSNPYYALGLACELLRNELPYSQYPFGNFTSNLLGQIQREHYIFTRQGHQLVGYAGWGMATREVAEKMYSENHVPTFEECQSGDCWLGLTFYAMSKKICNFQARQIRLMYPNIEFYFKREYAHQPPRMTKVFNFIKTP